MRRKMIWSKVRAGLNLCFFLVCCFLAFHHRTVLYLIQQAHGQFSVLWYTESFDAYSSKNHLSPQQLNNWQLIQQVKKFSVDSLEFKPTSNYTQIYDQNKAITLWVITASEPYRIQPFEWEFPLVGKVSYKGFFDKELAQREALNLKAQSYDVDLGAVTAWSTLGWMNDPVLSSMLDKSRGALCELIFHELFHATYYQSHNVELNENLASFIAYQSTLVFLKNDSTFLNAYLRQRHDREVYHRYLFEQTKILSGYYEQIREKPNKWILKEQALYRISKGIEQLPLNNGAAYALRGKEMLQTKNAFFIDFLQYHSLQDSLELVFNKIYRGNIKKMVHDLKQI